jgi:hypothetical protein
MVIYNIHIDAESVAVECLDKCFEFPDTGLSAERICRIGTFRSVIIDRVVAPVVLLIQVTGFVYGSKVIDRLKLHMGNAKFEDMIEACGSAGGKGSAPLAKTEILTFIRDTGAGMHGQIADMDFVDDLIGHGRVAVDTAVITPPFGIGRSHIQDHGPMSVDAHCLGIGVTAKGGDTIVGDLVVIIETLDAAG